MAFRFRRSIGLGAGIRLNLGKKSWGLSAGPKHARIAFNSKRGAYVSASLPHTGISYTAPIKPGRTLPPPVTLSTHDNCVKCGAGNLQGDRYCDSCGSALISPPPKATGDMRLLWVAAIVIGLSLLMVFAIRGY